MQIVLPYLPQLLYATLIAVQIAILGILVSWLTGLVAAAGKDSSFWLFRWLAEWFIWFTRGAPPLIQILLIYFGMRQLGVGLNPFTAGVVALGISSGGFVAEIVRSGMKAIPSGQRESCEVMGMSPWLAYRRIILPQMIRIAIPAIGNEAINTLKNTSLLSAISVVELTMVAQSLVGTTIRPFEFYMTAALIYLALTSVISLSVMWYERRNEVYV